jgi:hypothetical protein
VGICRRKRKDDSFEDGSASLLVIDVCADHKAWIQRVCGQGNSHFYGRICNTDAPSKRERSKREPQFPRCTNALRGCIGAP